MKKILSIVLLIIMILSLSAPVFADGIDGPKKVLKVAISTDFKPFEYYDENNQLAGFDIDFMNYIGSELGYEIEYIDVEYKDILNTVISGKADVAISMLVRTSEKDTLLEWTNAYLSVNRVYENGEDIESYSIAVKNDKKELRDKIEEVIHTAHNNGKISELLIKNELSELPQDDFNYFMPIIYGDLRHITLHNPSDWAKDDIIRAWEIGLTDNTQEYNYTTPINREDFCELIFSLIMLTYGGITTDDSESKFIDTDNHKVKVLNKVGIINGKSETEFAPKDFLTREEAATIIVRMINKFIPMEATEMYFEYNDIDQVSDWASSSIQIISNLGFMIGIGNNNFAPKDIYTAEQSIVTLLRIYDVAKKDIEYTTPLGTITSKENYNSWINFAIDANVRIVLAKDYTKFDETRHIINGPIKALVNGTSSNYITFDAFAEIFNGSWCINNNMFEFTYDESQNIVLGEYTENETISQTWPNKTDSITVLTFSDMQSILVNGLGKKLRSQYGGKTVDGNIIMYKDELYIPVQMVAELLGYDIAVADILWGK